MLRSVETTSVFCESSFVSFCGACKTVSPTQPAITVIGSINMDLVIRCRSLPLPGETVLAESTAEVCGGKGANQAVAAAQAGGNVTMIGRVGDDAFGERLVSNLRQADVRTQFVKPTVACPSGLAIVAVEQSSQNSIIVVAGANGRMTAADVESARTVIESSDILLLQLEIPTPAVVRAVGIGREAGVRVILDPAPAPSDWPPTLFNVDLLCPNKSEAAAILGTSAEAIDTVHQAESAARLIAQKGARNVVITLGELGAVLFDGKRAMRVAPYTVEPIDSTAAGDAFAGALAVRWAEQGDLAEAVEFANAAGAIAASRQGAQPSMATRGDIDELCSTNE